MLTSDTPIEAISLLQGLIQRDLSKRLGNLRNGIDDIKNHPFFNGIDWNKLEKKEIEPPFKVVEFIKKLVSTDVFLGF